MLLTCAAPLAIAMAGACSPRADSRSRPETAKNSPGRACFLLYELGVGEVRRSPAEACGTRVTPASTFKIPHALAALDSGVLAGPDAILRYDGAAEGPEVWKRDHTLATAMRHSVVWYFQRVATMLGADRESEYLARLDYGNRDASSGLTTFWLDGSLRISADEQEKFLLGLYRDALPVRAETMRQVREILVQPPGVVVSSTGEHPFAGPWPDGVVVSAKTGRAHDASWLVGHVSRGARAWVFVSLVLGSAENPLAAIDLAAASLRGGGVL